MAEAMFSSCIRGSRSVPSLARTSLGEMEIDPELSDTLMHLSAHIIRAAIKAGMKEL